MNIPFKVKLLTDTAKAPTKENQGDLWDIYADDFCSKNLEDIDAYGVNRKVADLKGAPVILSMVKYKLSDLGNELKLYPQGRILVKTGIALELPSRVFPGHYDVPLNEQENEWVYKYEPYMELEYFAVADIRPRSDKLEQKGLFIENKIITGGEVYFVVFNHGHEPYTITKGDKISQMLIRPLYPSKMEIVKSIEDTQRGGYGSTGK
jgi:dUTPase